mmetsp:Transcript_5287/g.14908  ORF Transcript_5287/g.14908 Transcript_5287/m.14908 type:complete len:195 (-) Transcript_5287:1408-1992(-)
MLSIPLACRCHIRLYSPPQLSNSSCDPLSATCPPRRTKILSQSIILLRRWAITIVVRPILTSAMRSWMLRSVLESREEVHSSANRMGGSRRSALAIATRCFSPPDSFRPRSPTSVSYPSSIEATTVSMHALRAVSSISWSVAFPPRLPYPILYRIVSLNRTISWGTTPKSDRKPSSFTSRMSLPPIVTEPSSGS